QIDRHVWTDEETDAFVGFIEKLVIKGRRVDTGGSFQISHCKNKVKKLKEKYQCAADMAACSGFRWDDVKQYVIIDNKEILAAYLKVGLLV
ncbi:hypothetical protein HN51_004667, partial [Arachis hypogaea]